MLKRFYNHSLIIFAISSMIILISVNLAISQKKQPEETVLNVLSNSGDQPNFTADPSFNRVSGSGWIYTDTVTIFIDDDYDLNNGWLHTVELLIDDSGEFLVWIEEEECEIQPGYIVTVTDGETTKVHEVTNIAVISVDKDLDTVSGTAEPFAQVRVDSGDEYTACSRHLTVGIDGSWTADFKVISQQGDIGILDIKPGTQGFANEVDEDWDQTAVWWGLPLPGFSADLGPNRVCGFDWIYTDTVTIFIDSDDNLNNGWLHTVELLIDDSGEFLAWIEEEECEIQPGYIVTVTDGETTKVHEVTNIAVISVDKDLDTVSGIAEPFAQVRVDNTDMSNPATRHVTANADGYWMADYSVTSHPADIGIMDVVPGTDGNASEIDDDCDETRVRWEVSGPISVNIDIKPGSYPNSINLKSKGKIPVAILTTDTFDATTVNSATVNFGKTGTEASPVHYAMEDVDGDGGIDMIFHFKTQETGIECGDNSASLTGNTFSGQAIRGTDSIKTVKCK